MKQKNLIMLGVAVGCGLVAAIAVAKLSAGGSRAPETVKLLVAKKDIPIDTTIDDKNVEELFGVTDVPKGLVPVDPVEGVDAIKGKSNNRTLKAGNAITVGDFGNNQKIAIPDGLKQVTFKVTETDGLDGFAKPGSKVDVHYIEKTPSGKTRTAIVLRDMLVLAVGQVDRLDDKQTRAIQQVRSVSLGVTDKQASMVSLGEMKGTLKLVLRSTPLTPEEKEMDGKIEWHDDPFEAKAPPVVEAKKEPAPPVVEAPKFESAVVAKKAVPVNTLLNKDSVAEYFALVKVEKTPDGAAASTADLLGKFVIKPLGEGSFVYKSATADKAVEIAKPAPVAPPVVKQPDPKPEPKVEEKPVYARFRQTLVSGGQFRTVVWLEISPNEWKSFDSEEAADKFIAQPESKKPEGTPAGGN